jgi:imidazolonepropionase-like amidohydrolase
MISFRHATVLACTGADPVEDATVIVEGRVIKDVLTGARQAAGAGGEVIDCGGELLGIAAETGTVEPGKRAELLVVGGDPLADIAVLQDPDNLLAIVKAGQFHKRQV